MLRIVFLIWFFFGVASASSTSNCQEHKKIVMDQLSFAKEYKKEKQIAAFSKELKSIVKNCHKDINLEKYRATIVKIKKNIEHDIIELEGARVKGIVKDTYFLQGRLEHDESLLLHAQRRYINYINYKN
ncbi:TPA: DUF1090 family protein [Aeromonas veronii]|nr:DUF1090 family protein [Aeromonas veronii]